MFTVCMFAEQVSKDMENNEFVYIICQNARTGRVLTVVDNREMLEAGMIAKRSAEEGSLMGTIKGLFSSKNGAPEN